MRHISTLVAALLLPAAQPLLFGTAVSTGTMLVSQAPAHAESAEAVAKVAQAITVRIEGATQGSGVLVKRDGNRYTVLTAWHVVSGQRPGEELDVYTPDGQKHSLEQGSLKRLGDVDMAELSFSSSNFYRIALVGDMKSVSIGSPIYVSGFPLATSAVNQRILRFLKGDVIANASVAISNGYQLLYSNQTLPGMSGGAALNAQGQLVGIHGQGETDSKMSEQEGVAVKTGTNQAVPIAYYSQYASGAAVVASSSQATSADDYLAQAASILSKGIYIGDSSSKDASNAVIELTGKALAIRSDVARAYGIRARGRVGIGEYRLAIADANKAISLSPRDFNAYFARANAKFALGDYQGAISDLTQVLAANPKDAFAYYSRGNYKLRLGDKQGAIDDCNQAISVNPTFAHAYVTRGVAKSNLGDKQGAIADYSQAISINPRHEEAYANRGMAKSDLGDKQGAIDDCNQAIAVNPAFAFAYETRGIAKYDLGDKQGAIADFNQVIAIYPQYANPYFNRGNAKFDLDDKRGAVADYNQAIVINPQHAYAYANRGSAKSYLGDKQGACADYKRAVSLGNQSAVQWLQSDSGAWCRDMP